ncbi:hypothetical protein [Legionella taurinensis]|uniref:Uncharacterized protein n=1 Tax=Legionella taurinensis TaxID=70611 RepID=A0A3A5L6Y4_9GAMM|nr:hypothetical protein [Legionella taurinensis]RJT48794.1 hypothetical protein D6J04_03450 [Legionella taurinensis]RJT69784.1 hypothetical protein D6J03_01255 [Legionella taurinensis]STY24846.1 Uncharacterised protein [Legionella taurinensis]
MQLKSEQAISSICLTTKSRKEITINTSPEETNRFGTHFLERINTPKGLGTVIGVHSNVLWIWLDCDSGPTYWDNVTGALFNYPEFSKSNDTNYPEELKKFIPATLNLLTVLTHIDHYSSTALNHTLRVALSQSPAHMTEQLRSFFKEFDKLSASDMELLAEEEGLDEKEKTDSGSVTKYLSTATLDALSVEFNAIQHRVQTQLHLLNQQMKHLNKEKTPQLFSLFTTNQSLLEQSCQEMEETAKKIQSISARAAHSKERNRFLHFDRLLSALIDVFFDYPTDQPSYDSMKYQDGAAQLTLFLYNHGHYFFEGRQNESNNSKQELTESLSALDVTFLFLLLSGLSLSTSQSGLIYLHLLKQIKIPVDTFDILPNAFSLADFSRQHPQQFIELYQRFFLSEGAFKQKMEELLKKSHPILLTEAGKWALYYGLAKQRVVNADSPPGHILEIKYYLGLGIDYFDQAMRSSHSLAAQEIDALLSAHKEIPCSAALAKQLAWYFSNTTQLQKARFYLKLAVYQNENPRNKNKNPSVFEQTVNELTLIQIKLDILEKTGKEQGQAINTLIHLARQNNQPAGKTVLDELSTRVPAVAFAAMIEWEQHNFSKLSPDLFEMAKKENPVIAAWYLNRYRVVTKQEKSDLNVVLQAVAANVEPAIIECNQLLVSTPTFALQNKEAILPFLAKADFWQHLYPTNLISLILNYQAADALSPHDLDKLMDSMTHASLTDPKKHFEFLAIILKDLRCLLDTARFIAFLYALKRLNISIKTDAELPTAIATYLTQQALHSLNDQVLLHSFMDGFLVEYPEFGHDLRQDSKAWAIIQQSKQLTFLINRTTCDSESKKENTEDASYSILASLSVFSHSTGPGNPTLSPMEMQGTTPRPNS